MDRKVLGGSLIVAGTAIGAGMLALPVVTADGGLLPASLIYILCWLFSMATGLLFVEVSTWLPGEANLVSMAYKTLGNGGRLFAWALYLFLFYCLSVAYVNGGGGFLTSVLPVPQGVGMLLFTLIFGAVVYFGTLWIDRINSLLMVGLIVTFVLFIAFGVSEVQPALLARRVWGPAFLALPVMFTSFSYQGVIPSLMTYMGGDPVKVRRAVIIGSTIPFLAYIIWEVLTLGIVPLERFIPTESVIAPLNAMLRGKPVALIGQFFAFFALTTSFLGVTMGLLDFLADSLKVEKKGMRKFFLWSLVFVPPFVIALSNPTVFIRALGYAGGIGAGLLLGFMPIAMVWVGRYRKRYKTLKSRLPGGQWLLALLFLFVLFELGIELFQELR